MPKRTDLKTILIIGAGPITIGQGCEFDYSGAQACKALKADGYRVVLVNSNPATIMTDPNLADATYIEPILWETVAKVIEKERPCAVLPTMGGQTALNCALDLAKHGILKQYNVELIGANEAAIDTAEDREKFREAMDAIGLAMPKSILARTIEEAFAAQKVMGFPTIIRPSFTLGGTGGGIAYNLEEFEEICRRGFDASPTHELLIEQSIIGWKEFELEVIRDRNDNGMIVCSIENLDPMGVHTGDSITVAPIQTLTDKEYQKMRDAALAVLSQVGVETGGSNVQFAVNPRTGEMVVIEMNPRVSRSSALASKATGFPIAKVAAKLAVGYTLDELANEITGGVTPASFEPTIDYVVTKIPRFNFEKFPDADNRLTTQMKSVGEVMAFGRTFQESFQKALRGLEVGSDGLEPQVDKDNPEAESEIHKHLRIPTWNRIWYVADAFRFGFSLAYVAELTGIDLWFLDQIYELVELEREVFTRGLAGLDEDFLRMLKRKGFSDKRLATLLGISELSLRRKRLAWEIRPVYKRIDSCAAEFPAVTPYMYSTYETECEAEPNTKDKIMVLGGGPNRIGQGIEFDYCCVHAALAMRDCGYETIMVNCNPETVSTDYDISDRLYFEPLTLEDVLAIVDVEKPIGVIVQYGGQTPLKLSRALEEAGVPILGTPPDAIDRAEDRKRFKQMIERLGLLQPVNGVVSSVEEGLQIAQSIGYPIMVRPSYVLGGRAMEVVYDSEELRRYLQEAVRVSNDCPVLLDAFLDNAIEVDVDAVSDGQEVLIAGIMEHIEQAGVHSGDSACCLPPFTLSKVTEAELSRQMVLMTKELGVIGLANAQFAIQDEKVYVLEVNPRASRTVPFISKATGYHFAQIAAKAMAGVSLKAQGIIASPTPRYYSVKKSVFPFAKFQGSDPILGPEMRSTGEVMGSGKSFGEAFGKSHLASGERLVTKGNVFLSVRDGDKFAAVSIAEQLTRLGFEIYATRGTAKVLIEANVPCKEVYKVYEGRPHGVDLIKNGDIQFVINTTEGRRAIKDSYIIRKTALQYKVSYVTTIAGARAILMAVEEAGDSAVMSLQERISTGQAV